MIDHSDWSLDKHENSHNIAHVFFFSDGTSRGFFRLFMLTDKQADMWERGKSHWIAPPHPSSFKWVTYLKRGTCLADQREKRVKTLTCQGAEEAVLRQTTRGFTPVEIPDTLKRKALWGDNDCACQSGLLRALAPSFLSLYLDSEGLVITRRRGPVEHVSRYVFTEVKQRNRTRVEPSLLLFSVSYTF